jgi:shikimate kinase
LTGFRGTGKSAVGLMLGKLLDRPNIDLDQVIEASAGVSIRRIFQQGGESRFRDLESEALDRVIDQDPAVISLGGGAILRESNRRRIKSSGICFWLDADAQTIAGRLLQDPSTAQRRPPLTELSELEEIKQLLEKRYPLYQAAADHRIDTVGREVSEVAASILELWNASLEQ